MLLIVCMRIYGDRVVSSDLRGEGVNFILGRFNYCTCVLIKHSYRKPKHCGCSNISAFASMKRYACPFVAIFNR